MAWLDAFLLGRPGFEYAFSANPDDLEADFERQSAEQRTLTGRLKERVFRPWTPTVRLTSGWFPKTDLDHIASLLTVTDTFLSFIPRTSDLNILLEPDLALTTTTVQIQESSATLLSAVYAAGGLTPGNGGTPYTTTSGTITVDGVYDNPMGTGTNYYTAGAGGSYADATRTVTLGSALAQVQQVYVSYHFPGWLVRMKKLGAPISGGRVDLFNLGDLELVGV
jgi:hypothetical protein